MALRDFLSELAGHGEAALRNIGSGATAGLTKYPAALLLSKTSGIPYEDALREVRAQEEQMQRDYPVASAAGQVVGSVAALPVGGAAGAGARAVPAIARATGAGAGYGAVQGFTSNEGMENVGRDVGLGAVLGGTLGAGGAAVGQGGAALVKNAYVQQQLRSANRAVEKVTGALETLTPTFQRIAPAATPVEQRSILSSIASGRSRLGNFTQEEVKAARAAISGGAVHKQAQNKVATMEQLAGQDAVDFAKNSLAYGTKRDVKEFGRELLSLAPGMSKGAVAGALGSGLYGGDPLQGALAGAGAGGAWAAKQALLAPAIKAGTAAVARIPVAAGENIARAATNIGTPAVTSVGRPLPGGEEPVQPEMQPGAPGANPWEESWTPPTVAAPTVPAPQGAPAAPSPTGSAKNPWEMSDEEFQKWSSKK